MVTTKTFGLVTVDVYEDEFKFGMPHNGAMIRWASYGSVTVAEAQAFNNDMLEALMFAVQENTRLGVTATGDPS